MQKTVLIGLLAVVISLTTSNAQTTLFEDDFNTGTLAAKGWTITDLAAGTGLTWERTSVGFDVYQRLAPSLSSGASYITPNTEFLIVKCEQAGQQSNETIETPIIASAAYTTLSLAFDQVLDYKNVSEIVQIRVSTD